MSSQQRSSMTRTWITVVVVLLCAAGFAYSQGWFDWSRSAAEIKSDKASANQALETTDDPMPLTPQATERAAAPTK